MCYYVAAEMHIFLSEVHLGQLASRSSVVKSVSRLTMI